MVLTLGHACFLLASANPQHVGGITHLFTLEYFSTLKTFSFTIIYFSTSIGSMAPSKVGGESLKFSHSTLLTLALRHHSSQVIPSSGLLLNYPN